MTLVLTSTYMHSLEMCVYLRCVGKYSTESTSRAFQPMMEKPLKTQERMTVMDSTAGSHQISRTPIPEMIMEKAAREGGGEGGLGQRACRSWE